MRLLGPRCRLRLRTLLILVALVAIGLGGLKWMDRRARHFRRVAMDYRDMAKLDEIQAALGSRQYAPIAAWKENQEESQDTTTLCAVEPD
jgi:hypothetical protein